MEFTFRIAKKKDKEEILCLIKKLAEHQRKKPEEVHMTLEKIESHGFGRTRYFYVLLAEYKKKPAGYALFFYSYSASDGAPILYIEDLFVDELYRNYGLGTALLANLAKLALEKECCRMEGHAVTWNKKGIEFFEFIGAYPRTDLLQFRLSGEHLQKLAAQK
ncbi:GNAT family N-acetyltransferase [Fluoribacter dumoffii]|uniref:Acetyltransferase (GNAT) family n=1 Tax=Fluoribacter dumoffii TaxID=463 RepID=A0A377G5D5_9GAMM|nr:GNAT family N-acetyltransferase [Fluoribacter dumoffii]KTC91566.1 GNAT family acetyltransferase [Fluoribacter dumoffii NY 23]MCW8387310.1 GNAT family N-acetyltransferase [Fluoribacter dumoffii]MCW8417183.1 GNAT family N-acetyltransferase [Fluoribacter dumoffii]MCW8454977.1 GNAT family N-acetyltransferase [Fluoribacter dumoffii]MCW8460946.1 GNAT family N-acetyltransferase [Fluoribacter dumoffii]